MVVTRVFHNLYINNYFHIHVSYKLDQTNVNISFLLSEVPNNPPKTVHFTIKEDESGEEDRVLDICKASMRSNQQVITFRNRFRDNQLWLCEPLTNIIRSKKNPMFVLDTHNGKYMYMGDWRIKSHDIQVYPCITMVIIC